MAPLVRRNLAQSNRLTHKSITVESKLTSLFSNRNFFVKGPAWRQRYSDRKLIVGPVPGTMSLAYAREERLGASSIPRWESFPSQVERPWQISRSEWARPGWQKSD